MDPVSFSSLQQLDRDTLDVFVFKILYTDVTIIDK